MDTIVSAAQPVIVRILPARGRTGRPAGSALAAIVAA